MEAIKIFCQMWAFIISICLLVLLIIKIRKIYDKNRFIKGKMTVQKAAKYKKKIEIKAEKKIAKKKASTISKVIIIGDSSDSRKKAGSSIIRGAIGGAVLGPVGLVGGALSGKNKITNKTTFLVEYEDGHKQTITVDNNSLYFNTLCQYIKID